MPDPGFWSFLSKNENMELAKAYGPLVVSAFAAIAAGAISWRLGSGQLSIAKAQKQVASDQKNIAFDKLRLDLFRDRFECYKQVEKLSLKYASRGLKEFDDAMLSALRDFDDEVSRAYFLYPPEVHQYLDGLRRRVTQIPVLAVTRNDLNDPNRAEAIKEGYRLISELIGESARAREVFGPFLSFGHIRS